MPACPPGSAASSLRSLRLAAIAVLLVTGCSVERLPNAPAQHATPSAVSGAGYAHGRDVDVTLAVGADAEEVASAHGAVLKGGGNWRCARMNPPESQSVDGLINVLKTDPRVESVERSVTAETAESRQQSFSFDDGLGTPLTYVGQPSALRLGLSAAQLVSRGGGARVAILDTGIDLLHPVFAGGRIAAAYDFVGSDSDPTDQGDGIDNDWDGRVDEAFGHGTHVAGIVTLAAPDAELLVARVLNAEGCGDMLDVARAIRWAIANGAHVINLSLGSTTKSEAVAIALEEAYDAGVVCVTSAGNTATDSPVDFPASSRFTTAVAAVDEFNAITSFTSYGGFVEICAPGQNVRSAFPGGGYALWSGTSMAAPFVSGGFALLIPLHPDWGWKRLQDRFLSTAQKINQSGYQSGLGAGALDLGAALGGVVYDPVKDKITE